MVPQEELRVFFLRNLYSLVIVNLYSDMNSVIFGLKDANVKVGQFIVVNVFGKQALSMLYQKELLINPWFKRS